MQDYQDLFKEEKTQNTAPTQQPPMQPSQSAAPKDSGPMGRAAIAIVVGAIVALGFLYGYGWWQAQKEKAALPDELMLAPEVIDAPEYPTETVLDAVLQEIKDDTAAQLATPLQANNLQDIEAALDALDEEVLMGDLGLNP